MALAIAQLGQPVLREVARPVADVAIQSPEFQSFLQAMSATMAEAGGVGLAAPQVFADVRVFLARVDPPISDDEPAPPRAFINPVLTPISDETALGWEGCLSFIELLVKVRRYSRVRIGYVDEQGRTQSIDLEGFPARVVQHEYDHLEGVLTIDRAASTRDIIKASEADEVLGEPDGGSE